MYRQCAVICHSYVTESSQQKRKFALDNKGMLCVNCKYELHTKNCVTSLQGAFGVIEVHTFVFAVLVQTVTLSSYPKAV